MFNALMKLENIKHQILALEHAEMEQLLEWLSDHLESHMELHPEFIANIQRGQTHLAAGQTRKVYR